ncbi:MAG: hypothetical protein PHW04_09815 [Candidatus Wallbacteria bacterium]|nr:hypothetical protein [Candidatus Wallbacteria bacterium]
MKSGDLAAAGQAYDWIQMSLNHPQPEKNSGNLSGLYEKTLKNHWKIPS